MLLKSSVAAVALLSGSALAAATPSLQDFATNFTQGVNALLAANKIHSQGIYYIGALKDVQNTVWTTVLPLGEDGRGKVAAEVDKLFDVWVNRQSKINHYNYDAMPVKDNITKNYQSYDDETKFHLDLARLFMSLRDQHTNYNVPAPYACVRALLPWGFDFLQNNNYDDPTVVVSAIGNFGPGVDPSVVYGPALTAQLAQISLGDELVGIDGERLGPLYFAQYQNLTNGANDMGGMRYFTNLLFSMRIGAWAPLPNSVEDGRTYTFKKHNGKTIKVKVPYLARMRHDCVAPLTTPANTSSLLEPTSAVENKVAPKPKLNQFKLQYLDEFNEIYDNSAYPTYTPTPDGKLHYTIYKEHGHNLGVIRLDDFEPTTSVDQILLLIRGLLVNELANTDAVVFDIRSNGGGIIDMANSIPQLFKPDYDTSGARLLISNTNTAMMHAPAAVPEGLGNWVQAYDSGLAKNATLGDIAFFDDDTSVNLLGNAYLKPVGVFNDAVCYSACDMFSANMQDSQTAVIFGQDHQTGGGGANVVEHHGFLVAYSNDNANIFGGSQIFSDLPYWDYNANSPGAGTSNQGNLAMRVGWRQSVRNGIHAGALIEDDGIIADYTRRPNWDDLFGNRTASSQFDLIAKTLKHKGSITGQNGRTFISEPLYRDIPVGSKVAINGTFSNLANFQVSVNGTVVGSAKNRYTKSKQNLKIVTNYAPTDLGTFTATISASDHAGKPVMKTNRIFRVVPAAKLTAVPFDFDFKTIPPFAGIYNPTSPASHGWFLSNGTLAIGVGPDGHYFDNTDTSFVAFVSLPAGQYKLSVAATVDSEYTFDFFRVNVKYGNGTVTNLLAACQNPDRSPNQVSQTFVIDGSASEVTLEFTSDTNTNFPDGAHVTKFSIDAL
ncbi:uncharacterized protein BJ171DRAFT_459706, partial [Polychytrium aggregatum]|uniref:uncharacterized protein n=1 Tax=Polychytrium aggregatum TaxID=110093 RepID=UPI0022FDE0AD